MNDHITSCGTKTEINSQKISYFEITKGNRNFWNKLIKIFLNVPLKSVKENFEKKEI